MLNEDKIFETYVLKRLTADQNLGGRDYLDSSEFKLANSESLSYLATQADIKLIMPEEKWITESFDADGYSETSEHICVITTEDILANRSENIQIITQALPASLATKIRRFEKNTHYLYAPKLTAKDNIIEGLKKELSQFENNRTIQKLIIQHANRIDPEPTKRDKIKEKKRLIKNDKQQIFNDLIYEIHHAHTPSVKRQKYELLLKFVEYRNEDDVRDFIKWQEPSLTRNLRARITTELKRDIYMELEELRKQNPYLPNFEKELRLYTEAYNHYDSSVRLLGKNGAFQKGGIYGPDSKYATLNSAQKKHQLELIPTPTIKKEKSIQTTDKKKKQDYIQLPIFTDNHFTY